MIISLLRRSSLILLLSAAVLVPVGAGTAFAAAPGGGQDHPAAEAVSTSTTVRAGATLPHIIPRPNSGRPPAEAGDRGGALQLGLMALIVVALAIITLLVVRESRRARSR